MLFLQPPLKSMLAISHILLHSIIASNPLPLVLHTTPTPYPLIMTIPYRFHFHLSDDEGWRLQFDSFPELTEIGSQRCFDLDETSCIISQLGSGPTTHTSGSGFYTKQDYIEILNYAQARHILVSECP